MGIRQSINENPAITAGVTGAIIVLALVFIIVNALPHRPHASGPGKMFYTDDDGKTWFADDATKIPPFIDKDGKEAVLCNVYKCGQTGEPFVGYMLKYTPDGQKRMQDAMNQPNGHMMDVPPNVFPDTMVKKPGADQNWVTRVDDPATYNKDTSPTCPDGGTNLFPVNPNPTP